MTRTMKAVVFKGPRKIAIEDRPIPEIVDPTDAVIKGHEFTGEITEIGSHVKNFKRGDKVVCPFTVSW
ncbi:hypothetical protein Q9L58_006914 [Maublancomyces gigas]|uniref:Alcohol dehydrogenase-like N-terminal domain-containing protein n=1 Tax=Discina gigas TaxID=1032678 RepID=A0ABR3GDX7_9PEZI